MPLETAHVFISEVVPSKPEDNELQKISQTQPEKIAGDDLESDYNEESDTLKEKSEQSITKVIQLSEPAEIPDVIPRMNDESTKKDKKRTRRISNDKIPITPEMREQMNSKFSEMKEAGMSMIQIASIMGFGGKSSISDIKSEKLKSIPKSAYDALMAWSPL